MTRMNNIVDLTEQFARMSIEAYPYLKDYLPYFSERRCMWYFNAENNEYARWMDKINTENCKEWIPLFNQEMLQEIIEFNLDNIEMLSRFIDFLQRWSYKLKTMNQTWLGFVMKEKFNRYWNGKEWREQS